MNQENIDDEINLLEQLNIAKVKLSNWPNVDTIMEEYDDLCEKNRFGLLKMLEQNYEFVKQLQNAVGESLVENTA